MSNVQQGSYAGGASQNQAPKKTKDELLAGLDDNQAAIVEQLNGFVSDDGSLWVKYDVFPSLIEVPDGTILKVKDQAKHPEAYIAKITDPSQAADKLIHGLHMSSYFTKKGECYIVIRNEKQYQEFQAKKASGGGSGGRGGWGGKGNSGGSWQVQEEALVIQRINLAKVAQELDNGGLVVESAKVKELLAKGYQPHGPNGNDSTTVQFLSDSDDVLIIRNYVKKKPQATPAAATPTTTGTTTTST